MNSWQQPTTGEPATGSMHWHGESAGTTALFSQSATSAYVWYTVTFSGVPRGSGVAWACIDTTQTAAAGDMHIHVRKYGDASTASGKNLFFDFAAVTDAGAILPFPLSSTKGSQLCANTTTFTINVFDAAYYNL